MKPLTQSEYCQKLKATLFKNKKLIQQHHERLGTKGVAQDPVNPGQRPKKDTQVLTHHVHSNQSHTSPGYWTDHHPSLKTVNVEGLGPPHPKASRQNISHFLAVSYVLSS